jgi:hypothetical protein
MVDYRGFLPQSNWEKAVHYSTYMTVVQSVSGRKRSLAGSHREWPEAKKPHISTESGQCLSPLNVQNTGNQYRDGFTLSFSNPLGGYTVGAARKHLGSGAGLVSVSNFDSPAGLERLQTFCKWRPLYTPIDRQF